MVYENIPYCMNMSISFRCRCKLYQGYEIRCGHAALKECSKICVKYRTGIQTHYTTRGGEWTEKNELQNNVCRVLFQVQMRGAKNPVN